MLNKGTFALKAVRSLPIM